MSDIPEWAYDRVMALANDVAKEQGYYLGPVASEIQEAFARYIAEHEEPPVDQLASAFADAMNHSVDRLGPFMPQEASNLIKELRSRGIEIGGGK